MSEYRVTVDVEKVALCVQAIQNQFKVLEELLQESLVREDAKHE